MTLRLSTKGQLVIPAQMRKALNLKTGDRVTVELEGRSLVLRPAVESAATLKRDKFGRLVLKAPPGAPPMTTESVKRILEEFS